jgi:carboxyl-terminal processing protease
MRHRSMPYLSLVILALACGNVGAPESGTAAPSLSAPVAPASASAPVAVALATDADVLPSAPFRNGDQAFATVKEALLKHYDGVVVTSDELDRAAVQGMLEHIDARRASWNKLLSPDEREALEMDLKGEIVGIGAEINFDTTTGYTDILGVLPGSPAEKAGITMGDRILDVDGHLFKGKTQRDLLAQIRGKAGETVTLNVLRDDRLITIPVVRQVVSLEVVTEGMLPDGVGYLRIRSFNAKTRPGVDQGLDVLVKGGARALVLDLRGNPGGGFEDALATAEALLPSGAAIVKVKKRDEAEQIYTVKSGATKLAQVPMAVLTNGETASGAELLTVALRDGRRAIVVGERTFGKWSLQTLDDLGNGYAAKYTISLLRTPAGETYDGVGVSPDVQVDLDHKTYLAAEHQPELATRIATDSQLRTAATMVHAR